MSDPVRNPFAEPSVGRRYARGRPYHHPRALDRAAKLLGLPLMGRALDVACGTGLSTIALRLHATSVVGIDPAPEMLDAAPGQPGVAYAAAGAEQLPFSSQVFDVLTVSSGVHWFDQGSFFSEAIRVLRPAGSMIIYDHFGVTDIKDVPGFRDWITTTYLDRYPAPPRQARAHEWSDPPEGFIHIGNDNYPDPIELSQDDLIAYLLTQSGTIFVDEPTEATTAWLREQTADFFVGTSARTVQYWGMVACYRCK